MPGRRRPGRSRNAVDSSENQVEEPSVNKTFPLIRNSAAAVAALALLGCPSRQEFEQVKTENKKLTEEKQRTQRELSSAGAATAEMQSTLDEVQKGLEELRVKELKALKTSIAVLQEGKTTTSRRDELKAEIDAMSDEQVGAVNLTPAPAAVAEVVAPVVVAKAEVPTFEALLAAAAPEMRDSIQAGLRVASAAKTASIKLLTDSGRCTFTEVDLKAMSQDQLDAMVKLANVAPATDFSAAAPVAGSRAASVEEVPAAPDLSAAIRAARGITA